MAFLNINKTQNKGVVKAIDQKNYMKLGKPTSRLDLFTFAVALGYRYSSPETDVPLANKESFIRDEYIGNERHMLSALYYQDYVKVGKADIDKVIDSNLTFQVAEKYAEDGFQILESEMNQMSELAFTMKLLAEMDLMYDKIKDTLPKEHIGFEYDITEGRKAADESSVEY